jgi:hypothetical protein
VTISLPLKSNSNILQIQSKGLRRSTFLKKSQATNVVGLSLKGIQVMKEKI